MKLKIILFTLFLPYLSIAQDKITIDLNKKSIKITPFKKGDILKCDSSYVIYCHEYWGGGYGKDTFIKKRNILTKSNNTIEVVQTISKVSYQLHRQMRGKSWQERDSILNNRLQKSYRWKPSHHYKRVSYKVTPVHYYQGKYPYVEIYKTNSSKKNGSKIYNSKCIRLFVIGEVFYFVYVKNNIIKTSKSILRSRKAVCCDFKRLVNNIKIIEGEAGCGTN